MKRLQYLLIALALFSTACTDFMDVSSESKFGEEYVYANKEELDRVLTSVYASLLDGNLYGERFLVNYAMNSDVEFATYNTMIRNTNGNDFRCFDGEAHSSEALSTWTAAYKGVERANQVIYGVEHSPLYDEQDEELMQKLGEAKVLRAMIMHDMVVHFGDIPFPILPTFHSQELYPDVWSRSEILAYLIEDLIDAAPLMLYARELGDGVERASREFAEALIARMALTRGGYSLRPDEVNTTGTGTMQREADYLDYYRIAMEYADKVISSNTHTLAKPFVQVFVDECNYIVTNNDDPIFEIPFARNQSGSVGYRQGPRSRVENGVTSGDNKWGEAAGSLKLNAFYYYSFDATDLRRNASVGLWEYTYDGIPQTAGTEFTHYANKFSKLWNTQGFEVASQGNTGINFPYMRYADVLLMYAEAVNEVEAGVSGANGAKAREALAQVRRRAFPAAQHGSKVDAYIASVSGSKADFFQAIFNERKWEFGGENLRWKDLVRWNLYAETVYETFWNYYTMGSYKIGEFLDGYERYEAYPDYLYTLVVPNAENDGAPYQNTTLDVLNMRWSYPAATLTSPGTDWTGRDPFAWASTDMIYPHENCCYSLRGYIRGGMEQNFGLFNENNLPAVRYMLPMPRQVIMMSSNKEGYENHYGY